MRQKINSFGFFGILLFSFFYACKSNNEIINPPIDPPIVNNDLRLKLDSRKINIFQKVLALGQVSSLDEKEVESYFGDRVTRSVPQEIIVKNDSTTLVKLYGITEKYKSKWERDRLYIKNDNQDSWELFGEKNDKMDFALNMSFYSKKSVTKSAEGLVLGQGYNMKSYDNLLLKAVENTNLIWLQVSLLYKLN